MDFLSKREISKFKLDAASIDVISETLETRMAEMGVEHLNILRIRLSFEEALLRWREKFGEDQEITLVFVRSILGRKSIQIELENDVMNPLRKEEVSALDWSGNLLTSIGLSPQYYYSGDTNYLRVGVPAKGLNPALKIVISIVVGILLGLCVLNLTSHGFQADLNQYVLEPLWSLWTRGLLLMSGPVIFLMVTTTLINTGAIAEQGGSGWIVVARYFIFSFLVGIVAVIPSNIIFKPGFSKYGLEWGETTGFLEEIFGLVPENLVSPIADANTPQILFLAFVVGNALIITGQRADAVSRVVRQMNGIGLLFTEWMSRMVPYCVAIFIAMDIITGKTELLRGIWKPFLIAVVVSCVCMNLAAGYLALRKGITFKNVWNKVLPPFITAAKTGSLDDSYGQAEQSTIKKLGVEKHFTEVSLPQGLVLYMPINVVGTLAYTVFAAQKFDVTVDTYWYVIAVVFSVILFVATPPVPGANLLAYIVIFAQLGIPQEALVDAMIFDIVFGILAAAGNQMMLQVELAIQADRIGLLDKSRLLK